MEFDTTTFLLEIINFLILIWILQRLFYRPVLEIIAKRKLSIDQSLEEAKKIQQKANDLRSEYENREQLWEQEKAAAQAELRQQFELERQAQLEKLNKELAQEREKASSTLARQQEEFKRQIEQQALQNGAQFAGLLLTQAAGPELEARLLSLFIAECAKLSGGDSPLLAALQSQQPDNVKITSVYPLEDDFKRQLEPALTTLLNQPVTFLYSQDCTLIAGARIEIGGWVMQFNLAHELKGFAEFAYEPEKI